MRGAPAVIKCVLAVDDDEVMLRAWERATTPDLELLLATNALDAVELATNGSPHLAIIDLRLGQASGIDLVRQLRAAHHAMWIVLVSSFTSTPTTVSGMQAGADHVFAKPITPRQIIAQLTTPARAAIEGTMSFARLAWEHMHRVLHEHHGNVTHAARALGITRSSLQRMLKRPAPTQ